MRVFWRKKRKPKYEWAASHDANKYHILLDEKWIMAVLVNGEFTVHEQEQYMEFIVKKLNGVKY